MYKRTLKQSIGLTLTAALAPSLQAAMLEEVVVTAQKREQSLQDVPISVSVTSGERLDNMSIGGLEELSASIPNVTIAENATQDSITIRAIGSGANHGFEQSVGTFIDGVYFGRGRSSRAPFLDVERVEILKGPQGVLFGKNTIAGALNISTRKPSEEFEGSIQGEYFDGDESVGVTGLVSGPLSDSVGGRLVAKYSKIDGYIDNLNTGAKEPEVKETLVRGSLVWRASDRLDVMLKGEVSSYDVTGRHMQMIEGGPIRSLYESVDPNYEQKLDDKRSVNNPIFGVDYDDTKAQNLTATLNYEADSFQLVSITAYVGYEYDNNIPANFAANIETAAKRYDEQHDQFSQELRLESNGDGAFDYVLGAFYQTETLDHLQFFDFDTLQGIADGFPLPPFVGRSTYAVEQDTDSLAVFGQATWRASDRLQATLGLRYTDDEKDLDFQQTTTGQLPFPTRMVKDSRGDSALTPSISVQYDLGEASMLYASFSQGFKSGGFDFESGAGFEEETVDAWETGVKTRLAGGSLELNAALFSSEFDDLQVAAWNGLSFVTSNAAKATTRGVEVDARWQISDNWMLSGALAYLDASYDDFTEAVCTAAQQVQHSIDTGLSPATCTQDLSGKELQFAPEWSGTLNLEYSVWLNGGLQLMAVVGLDYTDAYFTALDLDPHSQQDSFTKYNARIQLTGSSGWSIALVGKNLSDENTTTWVNDVPFFRGAFFGAMDAPRSVGIQAGYRF